MVRFLSPSIIIFASIFFSCSFAAPIQQQQLSIVDMPSIIKVPSVSYLENYNTLNSLDDYYSTIAEQVLVTTIKEIIETAPETYLIIHELQLIGKDYCRTSLVDFMQVLEHQLNHVIRNSLLASIRPFIDGVIDKKSNMIELNTVMSQQLGSLLTPKEVARSIIRQIYQDDKNSVFDQFWKLHTDKKWAQTIHHERNEFTALEAWLHSWLMDFEFILKDEFDAQISTVLL